VIGEAIVHVGMHKTGSSSIQETLSRMGMAGVQYLQLSGSANHSGFFGTLLSDKPENFDANLMNGRDAEESNRRKRHFAEIFERELSQTSADRILISAELLSAPWVTVSMLENLREKLIKKCRRVRVIAYVRPPVGYMQSAFQQRLKGGDLSNFTPASLYPRYRKRFEKLFSVFGSSSVLLCPFNSSTLTDGDVVKDFSERIGVVVKDESILRTNESLTLEAAAVLYAFRKFGVSNYYDGFTSDNDQLVHSISRIGRRKLILAPDLVEPVLQANSADIEWVNERLEIPIEDAPRKSKYVIGSEDDLLEVAKEHREDLIRLIKESVLKPEMHLNVVEQLDLLTLITSSGPLRYRSGYPACLGTKSDSFSLFQNTDLEPAELLREAAAVFSQVEPRVSEGLRISAIRADRKMAFDKQGFVEKASKPKEEGR